MLHLTTPPFLGCIGLPLMWSSISQSQQPNFDFDNFGMTFHFISYLLFQLLFFLSIINIIISFYFIFIIFILLLLFFFYDIVAENNIGHFRCCWNRSATVLESPSLCKEAYLGSQITHTLITSCSAMAHRSLHFLFSEPLYEDAIGRSTTRYGQLKGGY